jgi:hypothetical protein
MLTRSSPQNSLSIARRIAVRIFHLHPSLRLRQVTPRWADCPSVGSIAISCPLAVSQSEDSSSSAGRSLPRVLPHCFRKESHRENSVRSLTRAPPTLVLHICRSCCSVTFALSQLSFRKLLILVMRPFNSQALTSAAGLHQRLPMLHATRRWGFPLHYLMLVYSVL